MSFQHRSNIHPLWDIFDSQFTNALTRRGSKDDWVISPFSGGLFSSGHSPAIDVYDTSDKYTVIANVAGCSEKDVTVDFDVQNGELSISGETSFSYDKDMNQDEAEQHKKDYCRFGERRHGKFSRSVKLPHEPRIDDNSITAVVENGVLTVTLPKVEADLSKDTKKKIKVSKL